jgi:hypothetical protein
MLTRHASKHRIKRGLSPLHQELLPSWRPLPICTPNSAHAGASCLPPAAAAAASCIALKASCASAGTSALCIQAAVAESATHSLRHLEFLQLQCLRPFWLGPDFLQASKEASTSARPMLSSSN